MSDRRRVMGGDPFNGHEYVDLGLPSGTLWAKCNIGAATQYDYGTYFEYGTTTEYINGNKYYTGRNDIPIDVDPARILWGGNWRLPTKTEMQELLNYRGNTPYFSVTRNGQTLVLPSAGYKYGGQTVNDSGTSGWYPTSTAAFSSYGMHQGYYILMYPNQMDVATGSVGLPIRPVCTQ